MASRQILEECLLGGLGGCGAGVFTNPLDVVKTRMQLQGELKARGQYAVYYKDPFHALCTVAKTDGIFALQKGLVPGLWFQLVMNGLRLGLFQIFENSSFAKDINGSISFTKKVLAGAVSGAIGAFAASPFSMVKMHLQSQAAKSIAVGFQHHHRGMVSALKTIQKDQGIKGLWRGAIGALPRASVGSGVQLSTFSMYRDYMIKLQIFPANSFLVPLTGSMVSGVMVTIAMTPFDVVSTRLYNQGINSKGQGLLYRGVFDCFLKIFSKEGVWGFYKGWGPSLLRLGPHTILSLTFWDRFRVYYKSICLK